MAATETRPPSLSHVLETCLYVKSMPEAMRFYKDVMGLKPYLETNRICAFAMGNTTLLLFHLTSTIHDVQLPTGTIPHHGPTQPLLNMLTQNTDSAGTTTPHRQSLQQHFCLGVSKREDVQAWEKWFVEKKIKTLGTMEWERGGRSVYFEDPDGHVGEVGSRGIWEHY